MNRFLLVSLGLGVGLSLGCVRSTEPKIVMPTAKAATDLKMQVGGGGGGKPAPTSPKETAPVAPKTEKKDQEKAVDSKP